MDFEEFNMSINEIQIKVEALHLIRRFISNLIKHQIPDGAPINTSDEYIEEFCKDRLHLFKCYVGEVLRHIHKSNEKDVLKNIIHIHGIKLSRDVKDLF
jgi:hypothetical protein